MQLLLYCRRQYILQPDYNFRRKWLEDEYQCLETGRGCYCYSIDVMGSTGNNVVWKPEPLLCGIPMATHKRQRNPSTRNRKKKIKSKIKIKSFSLASAATLIFVVWVVQFANKVGDKLPFGDSSVQITQIRLPYPSKGMVHQIYSNLVKNKYTTSAKPMALGKLWISVPRKMHLPKKSFGFIQSAMNMTMGLCLMKLCDFQQTIPPSWCFGRWTNSCTIQSGTICRYSLGNFGWSKVWCW